MAKTDWQAGDTVQPADMNGIGQELNDLRNVVDNINIPPATLTEPGIVQLSNATNGTRENVAATEKAVGQAFQAGNERKAEVVAALVAIGVPASTSETWSQLIPKIAAVIKATGNATASDVIAGKTFSSVTANGLTGTIPDRGAGGIVTPGTTDQTKAAGRYTSAITVLGDPDLIPPNIRQGVDIFGVKGTLKEGPLYAAGMATSAASPMMFLTVNGQNVTGYSSLTITGLGFRPNRIIIRVLGAENSPTSDYNTITKNASPDSSGSGYNLVTAAPGNNATAFIFKVLEFTGDNAGGTAYVNDSSFRLPFFETNRIVYWEAFRV